MSRMPKSQVAESVNVSEETGNRENTSHEEELLKLISDLQNQINELKKNTETKTIIEGSYTDDENEELDNVAVRTDKYVKVMSLCPYPLNLSTEGFGRGRIFYFKEFGEVKRIMYRYLVDIINSHRNFLEKGYFYILNRAVIHEQALEETYSKILTKESIETILNGKNNDITISLFKSANEGQKELICQLLIDRRLVGEDIDLNMWDKINRIVNGALEDKYKIAKEQLDALEELKEESK